MPTEFAVASQCAPVLKGIKISNMVTTPKGTWKKLRAALRGSGIICFLLSSGDDKEVLLLYRYDMLKQRLARRDVRRFLRKSGYPNSGVASILIMTKKRYISYLRGQGSFPHELGVILGYPVQDVEEFIRWKGKKSLMDGYWKVYCDLEESAQVFRRFDEARYTVICEMLQGHSLRYIVKA